MLLRISVGGFTRRCFTSAGTTADLVGWLRIFFAADTEFIALLGNAVGASVRAFVGTTNFAGTTWAPIAETEFASSAMRRCETVEAASVEVCVEFAGLSANDTSRGASENTIRQASDIPVKSTGAGLHTRVAPGRFSSSI